MTGEQAINTQDGNHTMRQRVTTTPGGRAMALHAARVMGKHHE
jgi:hypothetical protein